MCTVIYKNIEIHNAAALDADESGATWYRFPKDVCDVMELDKEKKVCTNSTGVELRFKISGESATIKMECTDGKDAGVVSCFHVFRGGIQGGWQDVELNCYVPPKPHLFEIKNAENMNTLKKTADEIKSPWSPEVVRIIFDRGHYRIIDVIGDVEAPSAEDVPKDTLLCYGSSITHGSNALDQSHAWASILADNIKMDCRNLGMAGTCAMEPEAVDYIADEGVRGNWSAATLELGINVLNWDESKIYSRAKYTVETIAKRNKDKPIFVISPLYCADENDPNHRADIWRKQLQIVIDELNLPNVTMINGLELLGDVSLLSADMIHPNIYGVRQIADRLTDIVKRTLTKF